MHAVKLAVMAFGRSSIASVSGMEKVYCEMANEFVKRGHEVYAIWNDQIGVKPFFSLDSRVIQVNLGLGKIRVPLRYKVLREVTKHLPFAIRNRVDDYRVHQLAHALKQAVDINTIDAVICHELNATMVVHLVEQHHIPMVLMSHNNVSEALAYFSSYQRQEASKADVYQVLTPHQIAEAKKYINCTVKCIGNVVPHIPENKRAQLNTLKSNYVILHLGRVEPHNKRQLILIQAFNRIAELFPDWQVHYYGPVMDQQYKERIDSFVKEHHLESQVFYKGVVENGIDILKTGDIFAFPSSAEGFPLAMTEAMGAGLPVVGFAYAPAINELVEDGTTGFLVNNEDEFAEALSKLMSQPGMRCRMGENARAHMQMFSSDRVWDEWEQVLYTISKL